MIKSVERIRAELQLLAFAERLERLLQSHIPVVGSGLAKVIPMFVSTSDRVVCYALIHVERIGAGGRLGVAAGVESVGEASTAARKIAVAALDWHISHAVVGARVSVEDGGGRSRFEGADRIDLPSAKRLAQDAIS